MKNNFLRINNIGFTLIELIVVLSILITLLGFVTINLSSSQQKTSLSTTIQTIISDMKAQQIKAMIGDTEGRVSASAYGVHFDTDKYVLFHGAYSAFEASNFVVNLTDTIKFDAGSRPEIVFEKVNGEIYQFSIGPDKIILKDTTNGNIRTIRINQYGVIEEIN